MLKGCLIIVAMLLCAVVVFFALLVWPGDSTISEFVLEDSCTIRMRARNPGFAAGRVPIYLQIDLKNEMTLTSGTITYYDTDIPIEQYLKIHHVKDIVFIQYEGISDIIYAIVSCSESLVYPPSEPQHDVYWSQVQRLFSELKASLHNDELQLLD